MAILKVRCPECETALKIDSDGSQAVSVECPNCEHVFTVSAKRAPKAPPVYKKRQPAEEDETRPKYKLKSKKVKKAEAAKNKYLLIGVAAGVLLVIGGVVAVVASSGSKDKNAAVAKADPNAEPRPQPRVQPRPQPQPDLQPKIQPEPDNEPDDEPPARPPTAKLDDAFTRAAKFKPRGPLPELPPLPPPDKRPLLTLDPGGHTALIKNIFLTPDNARLITVGEDKTIRFWDVASGDVLQTIRTPSAPGLEGMIHAAALSPSGKRLAVAGFPLNRGKEGIPIYVIDTETFRLERIVSGAKNVIYGLDFSPDEKLLAVGMSTEMVQVIQVATGTTVCEVKHFAAKELRFHPKLPRLATLGIDRALKVWNLNAPEKPIASIPLNEAGPNTIAWSNDGATLAVGCTNGEVYLHTADGKPTRFLPATMDGKEPIQIVQMEYRPGDKELIYGGVYTRGWAGTIDAVSGDRRVVFREHSNTVMGATSSKDGTLAVTTGGDDNETYVWKVADGSVVRRFAGSGKSVWGVGWGQGWEIHRLGEQESQVPSRQPRQDREDVPTRRPSDRGHANTRQLPARYAQRRDVYRQTVGLHPLRGQGKRQAVIHLRLQRSRRHPHLQPDVDP